MDPVPSRKHSLSLFGRFELIGDQGAVRFAGRKAAALLAFLASAGAEPQSRERLATLLWGSHFEAQARQNLRQTLHVLRRLLGEDALIVNGPGVSLAPGFLVCDVARFEALVRDGNHGALAEAIELYNGPLLAGFDIAEHAWEEWLSRERQRLHDLALGVIVRLAEFELASGNAKAAAGLAQRAIAEDELREEAHRLLMQALAADGRRLDALRHYERMAGALKRELDVEPDLATQVVVGEIRRQTAPTARAADAYGGEARAPQLPDFPSIAVLPFENMSGDPDQEYFADGISEDLITGLSRIRWLFVIARNSSFVYKHRAIDVTEVSRALGVRYVLEGSVRRAGNRLRISAQLIDAMTGGHHWAERWRHLRRAGRNHPQRRRRH
jgi:TolB-like protein